jgi:hypothetical protein
MLGQMWKLTYRLSFDVKVIDGAPASEVDVKSMVANMKGQIANKDSQGVDASRNRAIVVGSRTSRVDSESVGWVGSEQL